MENIDIQVESLRTRFNTKKIFNQMLDKRVLTINEIEAITYVIKHEKKDGIYVVNDEIVVELEKGACHIKDNNDE